MFKWAKKKALVAFLNRYDRSLSAKLVDIKLVGTLIAREVLVSHQNPNLLVDGITQQEYDQCLKIVMGVSCLNSDLKQQQIQNLEFEANEHYEAKDTPEYEFALRLLASNLRASNVDPMKKGDTSPTLQFQFLKRIESSLKSMDTR